jgi:predicted transposase/invertase (TIGR01784 family)
MLPLWQVGYGVETREGLDAGKKAREGAGQRAKGAVRIKGRVQMKKGQEKPKHDEAYKRLFTHPRMVKDLLLSLMPAAAWVDELDFDGLQDAANSLVDERFQRRESDMVLRIPWKQGRELYLSLLLEFQSSPDKWMVVRAFQYVAMIYDSLIRRKLVEDKLPPVLVIVLYNGAEPWEHATDLRSLIALPTASALSGFQPQLRLKLLDERHTLAQALGLPEGLTAMVLGSEQAKEPTEFLVLSVLLRALVGEEDTGLLRDFIYWWSEVLSKAHKIAMPPIPLEITEATHMLEEHVRAWEEKVRLRGLEQGLQQGLQQGVQQGLQQGAEQGRLEGLRRGKQEDLLKLLGARFGEVPDDLRAAVASATVDELDAWLVPTALQPLPEVRALILAG